MSTVKSRPLVLRKRRPLVSLGVACLIALLAGTPAIASPNESSSGGLTRSELQGYAETVGIPIEEAGSTLENQARFAREVSVWSETSGAELVHAEWHGEKGGHLTVKRALEPKAREFASQAPFPVTVDATGDGRMGVTVRHHVTEIIGKQLEGMSVAEYALGIDPISNRVSLTVPARIGLSAGTLKEMASRAAVAAVGKPLDIEIELTEGYPEPAHRGGQQYALGATGGSCTGGFSVTRSSVAGISTAAHCSPQPSYYDGSIVGETVAGADRDVRWTKVYGTASAEFKYTDVGYYTVNTSRNPTIGEGVGRYGMTTGANSGIVKLSGQCLKYDGWPQYCGLFATDRKTLLPGDSGGPWYVRTPGPTTVALGLSSGTYNGRDYFSGIGSLNLLNMVVVTG